MRRFVKFIPWILPFLGIVLGYGYAYVSFHGIFSIIGGVGVCWSGRSPLQQTPTPSY